MPNTITKDLGPVSGYAIAVENGYTGTEEEWIAEVLRGTQNAQTATQKAAEAAASESAAAESAEDASDRAGSAKADALKAEGNAVGKQNDVDVVDGPYYHNNAKYYAEQAEASKQAAASSETAAVTAAAAAQEWATGADDPTAEPGPENNAKYYAEAADASAEAAADAAANAGYAVNLRTDEIPDTVQSYTFTDGAVTLVQHKRGNTVIRSDAFSYGDGTITETRTLNTGETLTIVTNLTTLETTVTYAAA